MQDQHKLIGELRSEIAALQAGHQEEAAELAAKAKEEQRQADAKAREEVEKLQELLAECETRGGWAESPAALPFQARSNKYALLARTARRCT